MIGLEEYQTRRQTLAATLPSASVALIPAAHDMLRNGDAHYRFRQDSDFYYLTGFNEPDALLVIFSGSSGETLLFNRPRDPQQEQWTGIRLGQDDACQQLGVHAAYPLADLEARLPELLAGRQAMYTLPGRYPAWDKRLFEAWKGTKQRIRQGIKAPEALCDLSFILGEQRLLKSTAELALMRQAADISVAAHQRAMRAAPQARYEFELEAELLWEFTRQGCRSTAYDSIVAGGKNACVLHYTNNTQRVHPGELILIDAGGEFQNYAADITRTFPLNGRFSPEQRALYELVLTAQQAGIACVRPGTAWETIQKTIVAVLTQGLIELGILQGSLETLIAQGAYKPFYMHSSGHWLGLDVHDVGTYTLDGVSRMLQPGMVLTVEPGLYIHPEQPGVDARWRGIGIRIEDDILVTSTEHDNLTGHLASAPDDVEALVRG